MNWMRIQMLLGFLVSGVSALSLGLVLWFSLLAVDSLLVFGQVSRHMHQPAYWPFSIFGSPLSLGLVYGGVFFLAALASACLRWSCWPSMAALIAYVVYLLFYLPTLDWTRSHGSDLLTLLVPLITAPLGGLAGERLFAKRRDNRQPQR